MKPGARFRAGATRPAGHIFYIPPGERPTDDYKTRPHFLVNRCDLSADPWVMATLAHMSSQPTEHAGYGCPAHEITRATVLRRPGQQGSFVIGARLLPLVPDWLRDSAMSAVNEVSSVRRVVLQALGMGEGIAAAGTGSVRGRLARVHDARADIQYRFVLTSHAYSARRRYQVVVPVIDGVEGSEILEPTRWDVAASRHPWWDALPFEAPMLDTAGLISLSESWHRSRDPRRWLKAQIELLNAWIDEVTLAAVEEKIAERLCQ